MNDHPVNSQVAGKPKIFYGYIVAAFGFLILVITFGPHSSFGVFLNPLLTEFGWNRATISGAFSLSMIVYGLMSMVTGGLTDKFGPRLVVTLCGLLIGVGFALMALVNSLWQMYLFFGVIVGVGMSAVWVPQMTSIARWFVRRRSLMTGIVIAGAGISQLIAPPVISRLIAAFDWRLSFVILGGAILVVVIISAQFLRRDPAQMGLMPYGVDDGPQPESRPAAGDFSFKEAVVTVQFWEVLLLLVCSGFGFMALMVHIVPHAIELGVSPVGAANVLAVMGGAGIIGNYLLGGAGDKIGNRQVFIIGFVLMAAALFWLMLSDELWMIYVFAIVFGFSFGGVGTVEAPLVAGLFGLGSHGLIYGVIHIGFTVGAALGPFITGYIFDVEGSYQTAFLVSAIIGVIGILISVVIRPTARIGGKI